MSRGWLELTLVVALVTLTWAVFSFYPQYEAIGRELLVDADFAHGLQAWEVSGRGSARLEGGELLLRVEEAGAGVAVRQSLPEPARFRLLRLSADIQIRDVQPGPRFWHRARLVLASFDAEQRMLAVPHLVADLVGTRGWRHYSAVFRIPDRAREVRIGPQLVGATGEMALRALSLREVAEVPGIIDYSKLLLLLWVLVLAWLALPLARCLRWQASHVVLVLVLIMVVAGTLSPAGWRTATQAWFWYGYATVTGQQVLLHQGISLDSPELGEIAHLVMFIVLGLAYTFALRHQGLAVALARLLGIAGITETLQYFIDSRQPGLTDFLINALGVLLGLGIALFWYRSSRPWRGATDTGDSGS